MLFTGTSLIWRRANTWWRSRWNGVDESVLPGKSKRCHAPTAYIPTVLQTPSTIPGLESRRNLLPWPTVLSNKQHLWIISTITLQGADGRNPAPPVIYKTLWKMGCSISSNFPTHQPRVINTIQYPLTQMVWKIGDMAQTPTQSSTEQGSGIRRERDEATRVSGPGLFHQEKGSFHFLSFSASRHAKHVSTRDGYEGKTNTHLCIYIYLCYIYIYICKYKWTYHCHISSYSIFGDFTSHPKHVEPWLASIHWTKSKASSMNIRELLPLSLNTSNSLNTKITNTYIYI